MHTANKNTLKAYSITDIELSHLCSSNRPQTVPLRSIVPVTLKMRVLNKNEEFCLVALQTDI